MENDTTAKKFCRRTVLGLGYLAGGIIAIVTLGLLFVSIPMQTEKAGIIAKWWYLTLAQLGAWVGLVILAGICYSIYSWAWGHKKEEQVK